MFRTFMLKTTMVFFWTALSLSEEPFSEKVRFLPQQNCNTSDLKVLVCTSNPDFEIRPPDVFSPVIEKIRCTYCEKQKHIWPKWGQIFKSFKITFRESIMVLNTCFIRSVTEVFRWRWVHIVKTTPTTRTQIQKTNFLFGLKDYRNGCMFNNKHKFFYKHNT